MRRRNFIFASLAMLIGIAGRAMAAPAADTPASPRLVSLAPSNTELIYSLGASDMLVAVSDVCDYPPQAKQKPKAGSFVNARLETITRLHPDFVLLVNGQEALATTLKNRKFKVVILKNERLSDISTNLLELGKITGRNERARQLSDKFNSAVRSLSLMIAKTKNRPRLFFCIWPDPLITAGAGSFMHQAATICGGDNIASSVPAAFPRISIERVVTGKPEILIMAHQAREQSFWKKAPWSSTPAAKSNGIYFLPEADKDPLARPGLRILEGLYWLSGIAHPELAPELSRWHRECAKSLTDVQ
ncbi:MAG: helical backbone metal receptor [Candidatus Obscuribacterales bacterium]|nr:helical backbone metal receptor [Candidatus Obscuribacterales bacterium]